MISPFVAHGIGGRSDLPLELLFFLVGGGVVVVLSFVALAVLWPQARLQDGPHTRPIRAPWDGPVAGGLAALGLGSYLLVLVAGLAGRDSGSSNIVPVMIWVLVWLVVPFASAFVGNIWASINPWRTMTRFFSFGREDPSAFTRVGIYPAALAFVGFIWLELVGPGSGSPRALGIATLVYTFYVFAFASWAGPETGIRMSELFTTYNRLISSISPLGRSRDGQLVWRGLLRALPATESVRGLSLFVVSMLGSVTYDGLSGTPWWNTTVSGFGLDPSRIWVQTVGLLVTIGLIGLAYLIACQAAARSGGDGTSTVWVARRFVHTLIPIALAYAIAHYFTLIIFEGQLLYIHASDPLGLGWNLFGTGNWTVQFWMSSAAIWYVQVAVIVLGHVAGVVLAHDRALADFDTPVAVRSQYAMLALMVLLTGLGLTILAVG